MLGSVWVCSGLVMIGSTWFRIVKPTLGSTSAVTHLTSSPRFLALLLELDLACLIVSFEPSSVCSVMFSSACVLSAPQHSRTIAPRTPTLLLFCIRAAVNFPSLNDILPKNVSYLPHERDPLLELLRVGVGIVR